MNLQRPNSNDATRTANRSRSVVPICLSHVSFVIREGIDAKVSRSEPFGDVQEMLR